MDYKTFKFEVKELTEKGEFEGYAAVFDILDLGGDVIEKGAFKKTLRERNHFPMCWYHDVKTPIGIVYAKEDDTGLKVNGHLNMEVQKAKETHALMEQGAIQFLSFGYDTIKQEFDESGKDTVRRLKELKLYEISPVVFAMQPEAQITDVKEEDLEDMALVFLEAKPYPNEHSARIKNPDLFDSKTFRRKKDGTIYGSIKVPATAAVIWGKLKEHNKPSDNPIPQAIRFPIDNWTAAEAKKWLSDNNVKYEKFEAAAKSLEGAIEFIIELKKAFEGKEGRMISSANMKLIKQAIQVLTALLEAAETQKGGFGEPQDDKNGKPIGDHLLSSTIEELKKLDGLRRKPHQHLFAETVEKIEALKNT